MRDCAAAGRRHRDCSSALLRPRSVQRRAHSVAVRVLNAWQEPPAAPLSPQWEFPRIPEEGTGYFRLPGPDRSRHHGRAGGAGSGRGAEGTEGPAAAGDGRVVGGGVSGVGGQAAGPGG